MLKDIAKELGVSEEQVRKWKSQDKWENDKVTLPNKKNSNVTKTKKSPNEEKSKRNPEDVKEVELTEKQQLFCLYYIKNFNATQAYLKAYNSSYDVANAEGYKLLVNPRIRDEVNRLKEEKRQSIMLTEDDILERYMRIAFADMTDFVEFGQEDVPVMTMFGPMQVEDPETGEKVTLTKRVNIVKFKDSTVVDGGLICQIKQGKDGAAIKLEDRQKALDWLANFFEMNPQHKHKVWFDKEKLQLEKLKISGEGQGNDQEGINSFIKATTMKEDEIKAMFEGDMDEDVQEEN